MRTGRHCVFLLHVHLVFVTKYRRGVFTKAILEFLSLVGCPSILDILPEDRDWSASAAPGKYVVDFFYRATII